MKDNSKITQYVDLSVDLPDETLKKIGQLTVMFGRLEHLLLIIFMRIENMSLQEAQKQHGKKTLGEKKKLFCATHYKKFPKLEKIMDRITPLNDARINLMHGLIGFVIENNIQQTSPSVIKGEKNTHITPENLLNLQHEIRDIMAELKQVFPISGISLAYVTSGDGYLTYDRSVIDGDNPLAQKLTAAIF